MGFTVPSEEDVAGMRREVAWARAVAGLADLVEWLLWWAETLEGRLLRAEVKCDEYYRQVEFLKREKKMDGQTMQGQAAAAGLDWDKVIEGAKRLLPILKAVSAATVNTYDDAVVAFLEHVIRAS